MSVPFQIICDSYTQVFYAFKVFQYSALKGVDSLFLTRPFVCQLHHVAFDVLKSHSPFPSPTSLHLQDLATMFLPDSGAQPKPNHNT